MIEYSEKELAEIDARNELKRLADVENQMTVDAQIVAERTAREKAVEDLRAARAALDNEQRCYGLNLQAFQRTCAQDQKLFDQLQAQASVVEAAQGEVNRLTK